MLSDRELMRYSRQVLLADWDIEAQLQLKNSRVVIIGAGGLGCPAAETLARAGVGHIHIIDDDRIEESNLQRQTLFTPSDLGQPKAQVAAQRLRTINELISISYEVARVTSSQAEQQLQLTDPASVASHTPLSSQSSLPSSFQLSLTSATAAMTAAKPDLLLDCSDNFAIRDLLNRLSVLYRVPLLSASAIAMTGQLALFEPALRSGCYHCVFGNTIESAETDGADTDNCANSGVLASTTAIMGTLQANAALQYLGRGCNPLAQKLLLWDGKRMQQRTINYRADDACPVCGQGSLGKHEGETNALSTL